MKIGHYEGFGTRSRLGLDLDSFEHAHIKVNLKPCHTSSPYCIYKHCLYAILGAKGSLVRLKYQENFEPKQAP